MRWLAVLCCAAFTACWAPKGVFVPVENFGATSFGEYVIAPGDVLQVRVFQQEAMSARVRVRADGKVTLPMVNELVVSGKRPAEVAAELQIKFKEFINTPVVTVSLEETRALSVSVLGEVTRPGVVALEQGAGVLHALAGAGGLTDFAQRDGIFVLRRGADGKTARIRFRWELLSAGDAPSVKFLLQPNDVVVVE